MSSTDNKDVKVEAEVKAKVVDEKSDATSGAEHPLQTTWTLYYDKKLPHATAYKSFEENLNKLGDFKTVEGFWKHYRQLADPDDIPKDHNVFMFRDDAVPAWESFPNGGCWIIKVRKRNGLISRMWEELLFACIAEMFEEPDIVGVVLSTRGRDDNISVWNRDSGHPAVKFNIGEKLKAILNLDETTQVEYKYFKAAMRDGSSFRHAKPYVYMVGGPTR